MKKLDFPNILLFVSLMVTAFVIGETAHCTTHEGIMLAAGVIFGRLCATLYPFVKEGKVNGSRQG